MILKKIASKSALLKEREYISKTLMKVLGRAPKGGTLDQLTAQLCHFPNFETAVAMTTNSSLSLQKQYATEACMLLGIDYNSRIEKAVVDGIKEINAYNKANGKDPFDESEQCSKYRIRCFVLLEHISHQFGEASNSGLIHPKFIFNQASELIDELIHIATVKHSGYFFFRMVDSNVQQWSQLSRHWISNKSNNSENKELARLTYHTSLGLSKVFSDHDIHTNIDLELKFALKDCNDYFGLIKPLVNNAHEEEYFWLGLVRDKISEKINSNDYQHISKIVLHDSKLTVNVMTKSASNPNDTEMVVHEIELYMPNMSKFSHIAYLAHDKSINCSDRKPPKMLNSPMSDHYYLFNKVQQCIDDVFSKMK